MSHRRSTLQDPFWVAAGAATLAVAAAWTWLSGSFLFGEAHAQRPIPAFLGIYLAGWGVLAVAWLRARQAGPPPFAFVFAVAVGARLVLWPSGLIQENDVYRYVLDGQVVLHGGNPYRSSPLTLPERAGGALGRALESGEARQVLDRIGHSHIRTIYPPAAQLAFAAGAAVGGWDWRGQRIVFLVVEAGAIGLLAALLVRFGLPAGGVFLYAWNPLVLKEIANSAHLDVLVLFWIAAALLALLAGLRTNSALWPAAAGAAVGMAVLSKLYPVVLLPSVFAWASRKLGLRAIAVAAAACGVVVLAGYAPFAAVGIEGLTAGLGAYTADWNANQGAFAVLLQVFRSREVAYVVVGVLAAGLPLLLPGGSVAAVAERLFASLLIWFLLIPAPFPWYAVPLIGLATVSTSRWAGAAALLVSGPVALYYLRFLYEYRDFPESWWVATRVLEHGVIWGGLVALAVMWKRSQDSGQSPTDPGAGEQCHQSHDQPTSPRT